MDNYFTKRLYLYADRKLFRMSENAWQPITLADNERFPAGIIIVGREHTIEKLNQFPVTDLRDLRAVLKNEFGNGAILSTPTVTQTNSVVFSWQLNEETSDRLGGSYTVWMPETFLLSPRPDNINIIQRAGNELFFLEHGGHNYSSIAKGALSDPAYFLMTLGVPEMPQYMWREEQYLNALQKAIRQLDVQKSLALIRAQQHLFQTVMAWPWKSIAAGVLLGGFVALGGQYGQLSYRLAHIEGELKGQNISAIVEDKKEIEQKVQLLNQLSAQSDVANKDKQLWHVLASIMEQNLTIIRLRTNPTGVQVRLESNIATEGLEAIQKMPGVKSAAFATAVQNSLGKQRFTVDIEFAENFEGQGSGNE